MYGKYSYITIDKEAIGDPYIIPEKGKTIFSYFRENTREATEYHNSKATNEKEKIELFYYEMINGKKTQHNITTKKEMEIKGNEGYMIYASPNKKKIYINPSYNLYYYEGTEGRITTIYYENTTNYQTNSSGGKIEYTSTRTDQK